MENINKFFDVSTAIAETKSAPIDLIDTLVDHEKYGCEAVYSIAIDIVEAVIMSPSMNARNLLRLSKSTRFCVRETVAMYSSLTNLNKVEPLLHYDGEMKELRAEIFEILKDDESDEVMKSLINTSRNPEEVRYISSRDDVSSSTKESAKEKLSTILEDCADQSFGETVSRGFQ